MTQSATLSRNKQRAIAALLTTSTVRDAARMIGLNEGTIWRYLRDPAFKRELRDLEDRAVAAAVASLSGLSGDAIATLREILDDPDASTTARVRASLGILRERRRIGELDDLAQRVAKLEAYFDRLSDSEG